MAIGPNRVSLSDVADLASLFCAAEAALLALTALTARAADIDGEKRFGRRDGAPSSLWWLWRSDTI